MKVLLTGAAGFIGSRVANVLATESGVEGFAASNVCSGWPISNMEMATLMVFTIVALASIPIAPQ